MVAHRQANLFGNGIKIFEKFLNGLSLKIGVFFQCGVEFIRVSLVMLVVMDLHRLGVNVGLQRVVTVWEGWKFKSHFH